MSPELFPRKESAPEFHDERAAAVGTAIFHAVLILSLAFMPPSAPRKPPPDRVVKRVTHLVDPPFELTQKAPNKKPLSKELNIETIVPHKAVKSPAPAPERPKTFSPPPAQPAVPQVAQTLPPPPAPATPKIELPKESVLAGAITQAPPPPAEKPKLAFQTPTAPTVGTGRATNPAFAPPSIDQAVKNLARSGNTGGISVGDSADEIGGAGPGLNLPPSAGRPRPSVEMISDPMGVDFKGYLIRVLATVRRNWFAIYPEAARLGTRGKVVIRFIVTNQGVIGKIVYQEQSGSRPLDEAAVAALSASNPLSPLPSEFKGQQVVLQFTFAYNTANK